MNSRNILIALALSSALYADGNLGEKILEIYQSIPSAHSKGIESNRIEIASGSIYRYPADAISVRINLEKVCIANGGNVLTYKTNSFGEKVEVKGYDTEKLKALTPEQKRTLVEPDGDGNSAFIPKYQFVKGLFSVERRSDSDDLLWGVNTYNTICKNIDTNMMMYQTEGYAKHIRVSLSNINILPPKQPKSVPPIEKVLSNYITESSGNKFLLSQQGGFFPDYYIEDAPTIAQKHCEEGGGEIYIEEAYNCGLNGSQICTRKKRYESALPLKGRYKYIGCSLNGQSYIIESKGERQLILTKMESLSLGQDASLKKEKETDRKTDVDDLANVVLKASNLPVGAQSENNIGNRKLVSTLYSDNGMSKLVNIQEVGGNKTYKNYKVQNNEARDITDERFVYFNQKVPQSIQNAKGSLVQQCSQYGAGKVSIDGYTATCSRQAYGNQCSVNLIYMRNDQFAGREAMNCK